MRKILILTTTMLFLLYGCSVINVKGEKKLTLEEKIEDMLSQHDIDDGMMINLEIKDDYIYVTTLKEHGSEDLFLSVMKKEKSDLRWIMGEKVSPPITSIADKEGPIMTVIKPNESDMQQIQGVKVFGEPAKSIKYLDSRAGDYSKQIEFWTSFSEEAPEEEFDIEFIKKD